MSDTSVKLVMVTVENNNKFYNMDLLPNGDIEILYGRVGSKGKSVRYPVGKHNWSTLYKSKIRKGYQDVSELKLVAKIVDKNNLFTNIDSKEVVDFIKFLMECSRNKIKENYSITTDSVTKAQIKKAWELINRTIPLLNIGQDYTTINNILLELYITIPRNMKKVQNHLLSSMSTKGDVEIARSLIDDEQSLLSTLESQITTNQQSDSITDDSKNILEEMGVKVDVVKDKKALDKIHKFLGRNSQYAKNIYEVTNESTQKNFDDCISNSKNKKTALLWHGSRNENWLGIMQQGLMVRPSNAVTTGAMFGNGLYFANRSQKSLGYSSLKGSHWTGGNSNKGFISLFSVHIGKSKDVDTWNRSYCSLHREAKNAQWDSVFAHAGASLRNDELIVYNTNQSTISYIIEMEK